MSTSIWNNSRNPGDGKKASNSIVSWLEHLAATWIGDLQHCLDDSGVGEVHRVRTGTRRLEAQLESLMEREGPFSGSLEKSIESWMRQMKKIRRAAGAVRDLDVHRKLMEKYTGTGKGGRKLHEEGQQGELERNIPSPQEKTLLEQQAEMLDEWLRDQRDRQDGRLRKQIEKRLPDVEELSQRFLKDYAQRPYLPSSGGQPSSIALESFAKLCEDMPQLNAGNLHEFRKKAKKARYLTESAHQSAEAKKVGSWIKEIQDGIGDWHDWLALSEEARIALEDKDADLVKHLDEQVTASYAEALATTEKLKARLLKEASKRSQAKKPVEKARPGATASRYGGRRA